MAFQKQEQTTFTRKTCRFCEARMEYIDYKDVKTLQKYTSSIGKIDTRKKSGTCPKHQRALATAIKRARIMALLPFINR